MAWKNKNKGIVLTEEKAKKILEKAKKEGDDLGEKTITLERWKTLQGYREYTWGNFKVLYGEAEIKLIKKYKEYAMIELFILQPITKIERYEIIPRSNLVILAHRSFHMNEEGVSDNRFLYVYDGKTWKELII